MGITNKAVVKITTQALRDALHIRKEIDIRDIKVDHFADVVEILVVGDCISETAEGGKPPVIDMGMISGFDDSFLEIVNTDCSWISAMFDMDNGSYVQRRGDNRIFFKSLTGEINCVDIVTGKDVPIALSTADLSSNDWIVYNDKRIEEERLLIIQTNREKLLTKRKDM